MNLSPAGQILYNFLAVSDEPAQADAVIAFGSYHTQVPKTAAKLVLDGWAPLLVCTGSNTPLTEHLGTSEAAYFAEIAQTEGLKPSQILEEPAATNTGDNIAYSLKLLAEHGIHPSTLLVCAMPPHLKRIRATLAKQAPEIRVIAIGVPFSPSDYRTRAGLGFEERLLAEFDRLREYPAQGFTIPVDFPPEVLTAETTLRLSLKQT